MLDRRLFMLFMVFAPSLAFWPSSIGKEALMLFGMGGVALGVAHLLNNRLVRGLLVALPGAWLVWVVRPHLLGMLVPAAGLAYLAGRTRSGERAALQPSLVKPVGIVVVAFLGVFAVTQASNSLGLPSLSLQSIEAELEETAASTGQGSGRFDAPDGSITPLRIPQGAVTVLLRPFPWEVSSPYQVLASLEGAALAVYAFHRRRSLGMTLRELRRTPFFLFAWVLLGVAALTFSAFANFGLLARQRSLFLPALYLLVCADPARRPPNGEAPEQVPAATPAPPA
jgi:hypothetical protein